MIVAPERDVPGMSANACAKPDLERVGPAHLVDGGDANRARPQSLPTLRPEDDEGAGDERAGHGDRREEMRLDRLVERESENPGRKKRDDEVERESLRAGVAPGVRAALR